MKKQLLALSLLACISTVSAKRSTDRHAKPTKKHKMRTCAATPISKPTTIEKSGCFCLTEDICGPIIIAHDDVELNLNCHRVDGNGASAAISADDVSNISITNGRVVNSLPNNGIELTNITGFALSKLDISDCNRALSIQNSSNGNVSSSNFYDNVSSDIDEASAVVSVSNSSCIEFEDVDVCGNTKALSEAVGAFGDTRHGIITVFNCDGIDFRSCKSNNNTLGNTNSRFNAWLIQDCKGCAWRDCEANVNKTPFQATFFSVIELIDSQGCIFEGCQANSNVHVGGPGTGRSELFAIRLAAFMFDNPPSGCILSHCQANDNIIESGEGERNTLHVIRLEGTLECIVDHCQINNNDIGTAPPVLSSNSSTHGIDLRSGSGTVISNCQASGNAFMALPIIGSGISELVVENCQVANNTGLTSNGILFGISVFMCENISVRKCTVEDNVAPAIMIPIAVIASSDTASISITDSVVRNNVSEGQEANLRGLPSECVGIKITGNMNATEGKNLEIRRCYVANNTTVEVPAFGISVTDLAPTDPLFAAGGITNFCIEDCCVLDNTSDGGPSAGIFIRDSRNGVIEGCELIGNGGDGVEITGTSTCVSVRNSSAIHNGGDGFSNKNDNFFAGNFAESNGEKNYNNVKAQIIKFCKKKGEFRKKPNAWSNIDAI